MSTFINTKITIKKPIKNKSIGYVAFLAKDEKHQLTVKAISENGKSRGIVGYITRGGSFITHSKYTKEVPIITPSIKSRIDIVLDLIFGKERNKEIQVAGKEGMVHFKGQKSHVIK